ncbi:thioredoxin family protein [Paenibacillus oenotherae]|uniref:Thioredoxin family protein n=1 Tax=Paenibacillus oenotherae TaxID=1435645 RepID=A0ABS7DCA5_9BACL|nr:thioredoxin family protein [Paenibacillus oenotherae]MBW7476783.1 thioredoxin family protein [Paenibacillus oenotherae]
MSSSIATKLNKGISPQQFIDSIEKNKEAFLNFYNAFQWASEDDREFFESMNNRDDLRCLILAAEWCGDVVRNVPVVLKALEVTGIPTEILVMEEHLETMDQFLTMGGRAIPIVIIADTGGHVLGQWGPRPAHVQEAMIAFKQANPDREAADYQEKLGEARQEMGRRYGEGTEYQQVILQELRKLLSSF